MIHKMRANLPTAALRAAVLLALAAATLTGTLARPAYADDDHDRHGRGWRESRREPVRHDDYYRQPDIYYSAPSVVYAPPGASLNFNFPLYR